MKARRLDVENCLATHFPNGSNAVLADAMLVFELSSSKQAQLSMCC